MQGGNAIGGSSARITCNSLTDTTACTATTGGCCEVATANPYTCEAKCASAPNASTDSGGITTTAGFYTGRTYTAPYDENHIVTHDCATGRCGVVTAECQLSGSTSSWLWDGSCVEKTCKTPFGLNMATVTPKTETAPLSNTQLFTFTCDSKFVVVDQNSVTTTNTFMDFPCDTTTNSDICDVTSGGCCDVEITVPYSCMPMTCGTPALPIGVNSRPFTPALTQTSFSESAEIILPCADGYCGNIVLQCSLSGNAPSWTQGGSCVEKTCTAPVAMANGAIEAV